MERQIHPLRLQAPTCCNFVNRATRFVTSMPPPTSGAGFWRAQLRGQSWANVTIFATVSGGQDAIGISASSSAGLSIVPGSMVQRDWAAARVTCSIAAKPRMACSWQRARPCVLPSPGSTSPQTTGVLVPPVGEAGV